MGVRWAGFLGVGPAGPDGVDFSLAHVMSLLNFQRTCASPTPRRPPEPAPPGPGPRTQAGLVFVVWPSHRVGPSERRDPQDADR